MGRARARIEIKGIVQGVGFRPFIYRVAINHRVAGWVINTSGSVDVEVEGDRASLESFLTDVCETLPPLARIDRMDVTWLEPVGETGFAIRESEAQPGRYQLVPPDIATCDDCRKELFEPSDRRHSYPFINCTNCGPRFTIIRDVPYDRPMTTMASFPLCDACRTEYLDPLNRRFHAQPNACSECGPHYRLVLADGTPLAESEVVEAAAARLCAGDIVAPKGLGGFHLACDATSEAAVARLRLRKHRRAKPLAVMMSDVDMVEAHCLLSEAERGLLSSPAAPIVLLRLRPDAPPLAPSVAPGQAFLGVMLPYTPFHHLLLAAVARPLVMTSANLTEEPIAIGNQEACSRLADIADCFVLHNREILNRCDDSVVLVEGKVRPIRRSRGYAPDPLDLGGTGALVLACGAEEKNTFCLTQATEAFLSQHIGDLENAETLTAFEEGIRHYEALFRAAPTALVHDLHPDYLSTKYALARGAREGLKTIGVQHHHAHVVAGMVEHHLTEPVIGLAFDGTGYGTDHTIWGGEVLWCNRREFVRLGHLQPVPMAGGAAAIRRPARMAASYLMAALSCPVDDPRIAAIDGLREGEAALIATQVQRGLNAPLTSSLGRLFDGVSALLGIRGEAQFEAQAAIDLEMAAHRCTEPDDELLPIVLTSGAPFVLQVGPLLEGLLAARAAGLPAELLAWRFHRTVAEAAYVMAERAAHQRGCDTVVASGGVFQNRLLLRLVEQRFQGSGLRLLTHSRVPCNDGSIALGQAAVARARLSGGTV